jgi:hypothetical protein
MGVLIVVSLAVVVGILILFVDKRTAKNMLFIGLSVVLLIAAIIRLILQ